MSENKFFITHGLSQKDRYLILNSLCSRLSIADAKSRYHNDNDHKDRNNVSSYDLIIDFYEIGVNVNNDRTGDYVRYGVTRHDENDYTLVGFYGDTSIAHLTRESVVKTLSSTGEIDSLIWKGSYVFDVNTNLGAINKDGTFTSHGDNTFVKTNYHKDSETTYWLESEYSKYNLLLSEISYFNEKKSGIESRYFLFDSQPLFCKYYIESKEVTCDVFKKFVAEQIELGTHLLSDLCRICAEY